MPNVLTSIAVVLCLSPAAVASPSAGTRSLIESGSPSLGTSTAYPTPVLPSKKVERRRHFNIATNPVGWLFGYYAISAQVGINRFSLRGNVQRIDTKLPSWGLGTVEHSSVGHEISVSAPIYLRRAFSGPFIEPGYLRRKTAESNTEGTLLIFPISADSHDSEVTGMQLLVGWHLMSASGLNVAAAAGVKRTTERVEGLDTQTDVLPTLYLRVGYAF